MKEYEREEKREIWKEYESESEKEFEWEVEKGFEMEFEWEFEREFEKGFESEVELESVWLEIPREDNKRKENNILNIDSLLSFERVFEFKS